MGAVAGHAGALDHRRRSASTAREWRRRCRATATRSTSIHAGDGWVRRRQAGAVTRVRVGGTAGMADDENGVPEPIRQGVLRLVAHLFTARDGEGGEPPAAVTALWRPYRADDGLGDEANSQERCASAIVIEQPISLRNAMGLQEPGWEEVCRCLAASRWKASARRARRRR